MKNLKKLAAAALSVSLSAAMFGCTPSIGGNTRTAMTIDGYDVPAGLFIYYTIQGYSEASSTLADQNGETPDMKTVKNSNIDSLDSTDWIQDKATEYCVDFVSIEKEFEAVGGELSADDKDYAASLAEYYYEADSRLADNGISLDSMRLMAESSYKEQAIFNYYFGFDGEYGCSEDELKEYFNENYARVKYVAISLTDEEGNALTDNEQRTLRKKAEDYAKQINSKSKELDKMHEVDTVQEDYDEYVAAQTTAAVDEETEVTTTTTAAADEETTTTTTDPYANERIIQRNTTASADDASSDDTETTAVEETDDTRFKDFVFNELALDKAAVYDYNDETIYVVIRGDLYERMTEDDYWTDDYIQSLQSQRYYNDYVELLDTKADALTVEKNKSAYRRYSPFKLVLEAS